MVQPVLEQHQNKGPSDLVLWISFFSEVKQLCHEITNEISHEINPHGSLG